MMMRKLILTILIVVMLPLIPVTVAQEASATTSATLNVRAAPSASGTKMTALPPNTTVIVEARSADSTWMLVHTTDNSVRGWVAAQYLTGASVDLNALPVSGEQFNAPPSAQVAVDIPAASGDLGSILGQLQGTPVLYNFSGSRLRQIYQVGRRLGNRNHVFTLVGDSITAAQPFMSGYSSPDQYNLGSYGHLQATIDYFSVPLFEGDSTTSFNYNSMAAETAFNAASVLDRIWTNPAYCDPDFVSPLECEYQHSKPAVAIIMLGSVDTQLYDLNAYTGYMQRVIEVSIENGVIPVLTTFSIPPDYQYYEASLRFNAALIGLAQRNRIPLINFWREASRLPSAGVGGDRFHLSEGEWGSWYSFNGQENQFGITLRNLLTLQALEALRVNVLGR